MSLASSTFQYIPAFVSSHRRPCTVPVSLATFSVNVPVIFATLRSRRFENDSVAKIIRSLAASDIVNGIIAACYAGMAWSLQPGEQASPWLIRIVYTGMYTFGVCSFHD